MTKFSNSTVSIASKSNVTVEQLQAELSQYDVKANDLTTARKVNAFAREIVAEFAPAKIVAEMPEIGHRSVRSPKAYSCVAGGKDVAVFRGKRIVTATGVLHADGSLTTGGKTYGSPSRADVEVAFALGSKNGPRRSGWTAWFYVHGTTGEVHPIEHLREGGVEQRRSKTKVARMITSKSRIRELKAIAIDESKGRIGAAGTWEE